MQIDLSHPIAFYVEVYLDDVLRRDVVAGEFADRPGETIQSWVKVWVNPPMLGDHARFTQLNGNVRWEWVENTPAPLRAEWEDDDDSDRQ